MIEVEHLTKHYRGVRAVDDISFTVRPGRVVGFLGPNGAGKSTAMRCMTGLTHPTSGTVRVLGRRYVDLPNPGRYVGVLLDASAQHPGRSGREILTLGAQMIGAPKGRVAEILTTVGLSDKEANRRCGGYSLGMRQRLGLAHALLGEPRVLILDEPANGLDPGGIRWMRDLLRNFADQGGAVLLSSHLLKEVEHVADDIVMIGKGKIVAQGSKAELLAAKDGKHSVQVQAVDTEGTVALDAALRAQGIDIIAVEGELLTVGAASAEVGRIALDAHVALRRLAESQPEDLEDMFLALTADTSREGKAA
ncbi:ABC-2 type transport system ATP-binding protein [Austwickia chelonae]|uniref:Putative ABC transporter ATP-binding protein n=1 Tax=Austwickia chelonae NBRC 105200 TaxID=1184607 RepID=K6V635_9MICO|nr:ATP-binding cassette domain-containing protein [Austwickia chelonae]GAB77693.1 putative ABC transporter ATP-binding protein [Austwickia chelonae NBRC 105200]SEW15915.1 ABC-2 type transport system ATP-binding protein [Austwickia chelonae]